MYRIMLADDEGIMLEALKNIITSNFGGECEIATAKTGRAGSSRYPCPDNNYIIHSLCSFFRYIFIHRESQYTIYEFPGK